MQYLRSVPRFIVVNREKQVDTQLNRSARLEPFFLSSCTLSLRVSGTLFQSPTINTNHRVVPKNVSSRLKISCHHLFFIISYESTNLPLQLVISRITELQFLISQINRYLIGSIFQSVSRCPTLLASVQILRTLEIN